MAVEVPVGVAAVKSVVEWIGVPAALGICTAVLFVPDSVAEKLRLVALRENHS